MPVNANLLGTLPTLAAELGEVPEADASVIDSNGNGAMHEHTVD